MVELTEVMPQITDYEFVRVLIKIREGNIDELRFLEKTSSPEHVVHMFTENNPVKKHDETHSNNVDSQLVYIDAKEEFSRNITAPEGQVDGIKQRKISGKECECMDKE